MQIVSLHEISKPISWKKKQQQNIYQNVVCWNFYPACKFALNCKTDAIES